ncbi:MAG: twin-arginine translocation signal domain-containing protein [Thiobacillus sp.]|nr:twin-arginine translocation signal domain-containing protein [Thiobacillus sp.]
MDRRGFLAVAGVAGAALAMGGCSEPPYANVDSAQLKALLDQGVPLYDIRRLDEWRQTGVVAGSRTLTFVDGSGRLNPDFLARFTAEVAKDAPVALICRTGNRTQTLARELAALGYTRVYNVEGGITRWLGDAFPVVRH